MPERKRLETLHKEFEALKHKLSDYEARFEGKIKEHPVMSVEIAFGVGAVVGALFASYLLRSKH